MTGATFSFWRSWPVVCSGGFWPPLQSPPAFSNGESAKGVRSCCRWRNIPITLIDLTVRISGNGIPKGPGRNEQPRAEAVVDGRGRPSLHRHLVVLRRAASHAVLASIPHHPMRRTIAAIL